MRLAMVSVCGMTATHAKTPRWTPEELRVITPRSRALPAWTVWISGSCLGLAALMGVWRTLHPAGSSILEVLRPDGVAPVGENVTSTSQAATPMSQERFEAIVRTIGSDLVEPIRQSQARLRDKIALLHLPVRVSSVTSTKDIRLLLAKIDELPPLQRAVEARLQRPERELETQLVQVGVPEEMAPQGVDVWERAFGIHVASALTRQTIENDVLRTSREMLALLDSHAGAWMYDAQHDRVRFELPHLQQAYDEACERMRAAWKSLRAFDGVES